MKEWNPDQQEIRENKPAAEPTGLSDRGEPSGLFNNSLDAVSKQKTKFCAGGVSRKTSKTSKYSHMNDVYLQCP